MIGMLTRLRIVAAVLLLLGGVVFVGLACGLLIEKKLLGKKGAKVVKNGVWSDHPICSMTLGICSALAITNKVENAIIKGGMIQRSIT